MSKIKIRSACSSHHDERIATHVQAFGGEVTLTTSAHKSGTDRISEALDILKKDSIQDDGTS